MRTPRSHRRTLRRLLGWTLAGTVGVAVSWPTPTKAHFILEAPPSWMSQDSVGAPEKLGPCGDEGGGMPSGVVTAFQGGQTITVTISEAIFHPGHYRIALAADRSQLPPEPAVTPGSATPCGTAYVQSPAAFPVLADGVFDHTMPFTSPQSVQVTLPANMSCDKCTLQVIEFMSDHPLNNPGGCFYHHCADISIHAGPVDDGGTPGGPDASTTGDASRSFDGASSSGSGSPASTSSGGGGGCAVPGGTGAGGGCLGLGGLLLLGGGIRRRRRS
jgi:hypothetical protein